MAIPGAATGPLKRAYEVVVVGAGIHGLALSYELARRGFRDVCVLEQSYPGSGASGRNGEMIRSAFSSVEWIRFYEDAVRRWHELSARLDFNVLFKPAGYTVVASTEDDFARCRSAAARQREFGMKTQLVGADEILELAPCVSPAVVIGGIHQSNAGYSHHDATVWGYARAAARLGVEIHPFTTVTGVLVKAGAVKGVETSRGSVSTRLVVNAAGAFSREVAVLARVDVPVERYRIEALVTESVRPFLHTALSPISLHGYCHQTSRGEFVGGTEFEKPDRSDSLRGTRALMIDMAQKFVRLIPRLAGLRVLRHWAGLVSQTADMGPALGPVPELEGFWLSCGWLYGFMGAPAAGALLAQAIDDGRMPELIAPFGIERLRTGRLIVDDSLIQKPAAVAEVGA